MHDKVRDAKEGGSNFITFPSANFEVKRTVLWDVTPCNLVDGNIEYEPAAPFFYFVNGSRMFLRNANERLSKYSESHPKGPDFDTARRKCILEDILQAIVKKIREGMKWLKLEKNCKLLCTR